MKPQNTLLLHGDPPIQTEMLSLSFVLLSLFTCVSSGTPVVIQPSLPWPSICKIGRKIPFAPYGDCEIKLTDIYKMLGELGKAERVSHTSPVRLQSIAVLLISAETFLQ